MNPTEITGLVVLGTMAVLLFWKAIQINHIEKSLLIFFSMFGFLAGFGWASLILMFLYVQAGPGRRQVSYSEWRDCVSSGGVITIFAFLTAMFYSPQRTPIAVCFVIYCIMTFISVLVCTSQDSNFWKE